MSWIPPSNVVLTVVHATTASVLRNLREKMGAGYEAGKFPLAAELFEKMMVSAKLSDFLTLEAYRYL